MEKWGGGKNIPGIEVVAYVDKSESARERFEAKRGKKAISPKEFFQNYSSKNVYVVVCVGPEHELSIRNTLSKYGFRWGVDAFPWLEFEDRHHGFFAMRDSGYLWAPVITFSCTDFCTLRCRNCSLKIPYQENATRHHKSLEELKTETENFFKKFDYVEEYALVGGEVLLWPYLCEYLDWVFEKFSSQYGWARIVSNSTQKLSENVLKTLAKDNVMFEITVYKDVVPEEKRSINKSLCEEYGVKYREIEHSHWFDFGLKPETLQKNRDNSLFFAECESLCRGVEDNQLIYCLPGYFSAMRGHISRERRGLSLDASKKELYEYYYGMFTKDYPAYCDYCLGFVRAPIIPVAEQL